jgi:hypothetical protein
LRDLVAARERPDPLQKECVVDFVEHGFQVGVKNTVPLSISRSEGMVDHLDRVVAPAAPAARDPFRPGYATS